MEFSMKRLSIVTAIALFALGSAGTASAQVNNCNQGNRAAGTVVGALLGGTVGGVIANDRRGFRGGRSFSRRGFGGRGFRRNNRGLGIALGALAGGVVGNQVAAAKSRNCAAQNHNSFHNGQSLSGGPIDYNARRLGDPYGGRSIVNQTGTVVTQPAASNQGQVLQQGANQNVFQPVCQNVNRSTRLPDGNVVNEPIEYCQFSPGGEWIQR